MSLSMTSTFHQADATRGAQVRGYSLRRSRLVLFIIAEPLGWLGVGATVWCYYFFRDPERVTPKGDPPCHQPCRWHRIADRTCRAAAELGMADTPLTRVSVFMNVFNCHVNRAPVAGEITEIAYRPGKFFNASLDKASEDNERKQPAYQKWPMAARWQPCKSPDCGASYRLLH